jgi:hypothetical protein
VPLTPHVAYDRVAAYFRKLTWFAIGIAALGGLAGLAIGSTQARTVVWVIAGVLAVGTLAIALVESDRYERAAEVARDSEDRVNEPQADEVERAREKMLQRYQRAFGRLSVLCLVVGMSGFIVGALLSGPARALVIAMVGFGGILIAWMALVIRKRIGTGPKVP